MFIDLISTRIVLDWTILNALVNNRVIKEESEINNPIPELYYQLTLYFDYLLIL